MRSGINQPGCVQANYRTKKHSPHQERQATDRKQRNAEDNNRYVVILGEPDMGLRLREIGHVAGKSFGVLVKAFAHQDPSHVGPLIAVNWRMRVTFVIRKLVMNAMRGYPEDRPAFEGEGSANRQKIF